MNPQYKNSINIFKAKNGPTKINTVQSRKNDLANGKIVSILY